MNGKTMIREVAATHLLAVWMLSAACSKDQKKEETEPVQHEAPQAAQAAPGNADALVAEIGVEPGPVQQTGGAAAVLAAVSGQIEVRRLGESTFASAKQDDLLYAGDQVRAALGAEAVVLFPDASTAQLAEGSTLAIGSRAVTADPASSAAVLAGVARFSVSPRAPGEGPFMVFTPAGIVATKGTVFGVGVAADGDARVGVESGEVEVAGAVALDAPISVAASQAVELTASGEGAAPKPWPEDDWGAWRDQAEAELDLSATASAHAAGMAELGAELQRGYSTLAELGAEVSAFEANAAAKAEAGDAAGYGAALAPAGVAMEASFLAALRLSWLTHAYASRAALAEELYVRQPDQVAWKPLQAHVAAAVLWPKRFDATAVTMLEPLRMQYYLHHGRGRAHAQLVGVAVPAFYAKVTPPELATAEVRAKLDGKAFSPPSVRVDAAASARPVWVTAPGMRWQAKLKASPASARGKAGFWVRPPEMKSKLLLAARVGKVPPAFSPRPPQARGQLKAEAAFDLGQRIKVAPPDLGAAAKARARFTLAAPEPRAGGKAQLRGKLTAPEVKGEAGGKRAARGKLDAKAKLAAGGKAKALAGAPARGRAHAKADAKVKIKAPAIKPPKVKLESKASAKLKLGK